VHSIVKYERFTCDDDVFDEYIELVKRVDERYYLSVKRYTGGAFLRHKLGTELAKRHISSGPRSHEAQDVVRRLGSPHDYWHWTVTAGSEIERGH